MTRAFRMSLSYELLFKSWIKANLLEIPLTLLSKFKSKLWSKFESKLKF